MCAGHGLQIRASYVIGSRITNPRQLCDRVTDYKSAPAMCAGHGLQIRAIDVCGSRIANPRHRCVWVTDYKSAPALETENPRQHLKQKIRAST
jgi:hypothetical protein